MSVADGLSRVHERIARACAKAGRSASEVTLVAVSKTHGPEAIREAYAAGQRIFGENYVQELVGKANALADLPDLQWHFIGHLQRNKVRDVLRVGALIETLDSVRLAREIDKRAERASVFVQVNVAGEAQKSGCAPEELDGLIAEVRGLSHLELRGLMTVPPLGEGPEVSRRYFAQLRELAAAHGLSGLSMGMSADLEVAIEEGATLVRVGTAVFGARG